MILANPYDSLLRGQLGRRGVNRSRPLLRVTPAVAGAVSRYSSQRRRRLRLTQGLAIAIAERNRKLLLPGGALPAHRIPPGLRYRFHPHAVYLGDVQLEGLFSFLKKIKPFKLLGKVAPYVIGGVVGGKLARLVPGVARRILGRRLPVLTTVPTPPFVPTPSGVPEIGPPPTVQFRLPAEYAPAVYPGVPTAAEVAPGVPTAAEVAPGLEPPARGPGMPGWLLPVGLGVLALVMLRPRR